MRYTYTVQHVPTGESWQKEETFESYIAFLESLVKWNKQGVGSWSYYV